MENSMGAAAAAGRERQSRLMLPPGIRFLPTDEELITVYLRNKVAGRPLPWGFQIPTHELYVPDADPWAIQRKVAFPYGKGSEFYCFTSRRRRGSGAFRTAGSGTWAAKSKVVAVRAARTGQVVGLKLMLKFVPKGTGEDGGDEGANWIMHEYRLPDHGGGSTSSSSSSKGKAKQFQETVLCRIYQRSSTETGAPESSEESEAASSVTTFSP